MPAIRNSSTKGVNFKFICITLLTEKKQKRVKD